MTLKDMHPKKTKFKKLPMSVTLRIDGTNPISILKGLEELSAIFKQFHFPKKGQVILDKQFNTPNWRVKVLDTIASLEDPRAHL